MAASPENWSSVLSLLIEVPLRLHLARLGERYRGGLTLLLLFLLCFIFGGTFVPLFRGENVPIDCVFSPRKFVEWSKFDILSESNAGRLKPA